MPFDLNTLLQWLAGGGVVAVGFGINKLRKDNAKTSSEVKTQRAFDSGLEYITTRERQHLERIEKRAEQVEADNKLLNMELHDRDRKVSEQAELIARLQERYARAGVKTIDYVTRAHPGVDVKEAASDTGFGDLLD